MATIFFDTCAINFLVDQGKRAHEIKKQLTRYNVPVIGRNTLYECARSYQNQDRCKAVHEFIEELDPEYTLTRDQYYICEVLKLKRGIEFAYWCSINEKQRIKESNRCFITNNFGREVQQYIDEREKAIKQAQYIRSPDRNNQLTQKQKSPYKIPFDDRVKRALRHNEIPGLLLPLFQKINLPLSLGEIKQLLISLDQYPALRTWIRSLIHLSDHSICEQGPPARDRFLDAMQFIEASYCTTFVSDEHKLVNDFKKSRNEADLYGRKLNPTIELLHVKNFMTYLNQGAIK